MAKPSIASRRPRIIRRATKTKPMLPLDVEMLEQRQLLSVAALNQAVVTTFAHNPAIQLDAATKGTPPAAPTVTGSALSDSSIQLTWTAPTGAQNYKVETSLDGGTTWVTLINGLPATTYVVTGLTVDTSYKFRVSSIGAGGTSAPSTIIATSTLLDPPTGFAAASTGATTVHLTWNQVTDATSYLIQRSTNDVTFSNLTPSPVLTGSSTSYNDTTATAGTVYFYRISAEDTAGVSAAGTPVFITTLPAAPVVTGTSVSDSEIDLAWASVNSAFEYMVQRSVDGGNTWSTVSLQNFTGYQDTGLTADKSYEYRVYAINSSGASAASGTVTKSTLLNSPTGFVAQDFSNTRVDLSWIAVPDATSYILERGVNTTTFTTINAGLTSTSVSYSDTSASSATTYNYKIAAIDAAGTSAFTALASALTAPAAPAITGSVTSATALALTWGAVANATSYKVETSVNGGLTWNVLAASQSTTSYSDTSLTADTSHEYRVTAIDGSGGGPISNVVNLSTLLPAPSSFTAVATSAIAIHLSWNLENDATAFKLERSTNNTTFTTLAQSPVLTGSGVTYNDTTVTAGATYYYRLSAIDAAGTSAASTVSSALTLPAKPVLTATINSATQITLNWTAITSAVNYKLESSSNGGASWTTLVTQSTTSYVNSSLNPDTAYQYRLTAINASGNSIVSTVITATTILPSALNFSATPASATSVQLVWTPTPDAANYEILRSSNNSTFTTLVHSPAFTGSTASYTDNTVTAGATYYYKLEGVNTNGTSAATSVSSALTYPGAPTLTGSVISSSQINLTWTAQTSATDYTLQSSSNAGTNWSTLATQTATAYSNNSGLTSDEALEYRVLAINGTGSGANSNVVSVKTLLAPPTGFTVTPATATSITLHWNQVTDATTYQIQRSTNNTTFANVTPNPALTGPSTTYTDSTVAGGTTYYYHIAAIDSAGTSTFTTSSSALTVPVAPTLTATVISATQINLSWTASTGAAVTNGYTLQMSSDGGSTYSTIATQSATTFQKTSLTPGTAYKFRVAANDATGAGAFSTVISATTQLGAPLNFAGSVTSATSIHLTWVAEANATGYVLQRSTNNTTFTTVTPSPAFTGASSTYTDSAVSAATTYYYKLEATGTGFTTPATSTINFLTLPATPALTANLISANEINLTWGAITGATSYQLLQSADGGSTWTPLALPTPVATGVSAVGLTSDTSYKYKVAAIDPTGTSTFSNTTTTTTLLITPPGFAAAVVSGTEVDLTWTTVTDASSYKIERSLDAINWTALAPSPALNGASSGYHDTAVSAGTQYFYRISADDTAGFSATSAITPALTLPSTPTLAATVASATEIDLSWNSVQSANTYKLETSLDGGTTWSTLTNSGATSYADISLTADTAYEFRLSADNSTGFSTVGTVQTATTDLATPTGFAATPFSTTQINLTWTSETDATTYLIKRSTDNVTFTALTTTGLVQASNSFNDTTALAGTQYYYEFFAVDASGDSADETAQALTIPAAPTLSGSQVSATSNSLSWTSVNGAATYTLQSSANAGTSWSTLTSTGNTFYLDTSLTADSSYEYRVLANDATGNGADSSTVSLTTILAAPAALSSQPVSATSITLTWTAIPDATSYLLERSTDDVTFTAVTQSPTLTSSSSSYADNTVSAGTTYYYELSAINANGTSVASTTNSLTIPAVPTVTAAPATATSINLSWTPEVGAATYTLQISADLGTTWSTLTNTANTTFTATSLTADTSYEFQVKSQDATGSSAYSTAATSTTILAAPAAFAATSPTDASVALTWTTVVDATGYLLQRSIDDTIFTTVTQSPTILGTGSSYTDSTVSPGTTYYYRLTAIDAAGNSATSSTSILTIPAAPTVTATAGSSTDIQLTWQPIAGATTYTLQHSADAGSTWTTISNSSSLSFDDTSLTADTSYEYRLTANDATGPSAESGTVTASTLLGAPAAFAATSPSATSVALTWTAIPDATSYILYRSTDNTIFGTVTQSPTLTSSNSSYTDTVSAGTTYYYRLAAIDAAGTSVASTATIQSLPTAPSLNATPVTATAIYFNWAPVTGATSYLLQVSTDGGTTFTTATNTNSTSFNDNTLTADTSYEFKLAALNPTGTSAFSGVNSVSTILAAPAALSATGTASAVTLTWTAIPDATSYVLMRSTNDAAFTALSPAPAAGVSTYTDSTVAAGTNYFYELFAVDAAGTSAAATATQLTKPAAPTLTATTISATEIDLSWTGVKSATGYTLAQSTDGGTTWSNLTNTTAIKYSDTSLTAATSYEFEVLSTNGTGNSAESSVITASTILNPPTGFAVSSETATSVSLGWTVVSGATGYVIEQSTDDVTWTTLTGSLSLIGSSTTYTDNTVVAGTLYYYRISSTNANGQSVPCTVISTTTVLSAPSGLQATVNSDTQITLTWPADNSSGLTGYVLQTSADGGTTWMTLATTGPSGLSAIDSGLSASTLYEFRLEAVNAGGNSAPGSVQSATTT